MGLKSTSSLSTVSSVFGFGGAFKKGLAFLLNLAWKSRFRLPVLITVGFMVLDAKMQLLSNLDDEGNDDDDEDEDDDQDEDDDDQYEDDDDEDDDGEEEIEELEEDDDEIIEKEDENYQNAHSHSSARENKENMYPVNQ